MEVLSGFDTLQAKLGDKVIGDGQMAAHKLIQYSARNMPSETRLTQGKHVAPNPMMNRRLPSQTSSDPETPKCKPPNAMN
jgi:hypothetical protein